MINVNFSTKQYKNAEAPQWSQAKTALSQTKESQTVQDSLQLTSSLSANGQHSSDADLLARRIVGKRGDPSEVKILTATQGNDEINISRSEKGGITVDINGRRTDFTSEEAKKLVIDGGEGNDRIIVQEDVRVPLFITGGQGNDFIQGGSGNDTIIDNYGQNEIYGGQGNDTIIAGGLDLTPDAPPLKTIEGHSINGNIISGGLGRDYIEGSNNNDYIVDEGGGGVIYGLGGDDLITVTSGQNYVDGGQGNDAIKAEGGRNMLFGGRGDDTIEVKGGSNVIVDGSGSNNISTADSSSCVYTSSSTKVAAGANTSVEETVSVPVPEFFQISGDSSFKNRVTSDLEALSDIPIGQKAFAAIAETGKKVNVSETPSGNQCSSGADGYFDHEDNKPNSGSDSTIYYNRASVSLNTEAAWQDRPPLVGFHHELMHSYNAATGTMDNWAYDPYNGGYATGPFGVTGAEFQAVGLDSHLVKANPEGLSENSMRSFLGLERRDRY